MQWAGESAKIGKPGSESEKVNKVISARVQRDDLLFGERAALRNGCEVGSKLSVVADRDFDLAAGFRIWRQIRWRRFGNPCLSSQPFSDQWLDQFLNFRVRDLKRIEIDEQGTVGGMETMNAGVAKPLHGMK